MWRISSTAITSLPIFSLLNSVLSSKLHATMKEVRQFENSLLSLWEDYFAFYNASRQHGQLQFPSPLPLRPLFLQELVVEMPAWDNREKQVAALRAYVSTLPPTPLNRIRKENFEWFMTDIMERRFGSRRLSNLDVSHQRLEEEVIWPSLKKRAGGQLSTLDRAASFVSDKLGGYILLVIGFLYLIFRICIIVLALISLRSMPDSVYDATWAKNIPSVQ